MSGEIEDNKKMDEHSAKNNKDRKSELNISSDELKKMPVLGKGACATVYKHGDKAIKILNLKGEQMHDEEQFSQLMKIKSQLCAFPEQKVQIDGCFKGYIMEFVDGGELKEYIDRIDLADLISALKKAEMDIEELSKNKVLFQDLHKGGVMWDDKKKRIRIIDTDFFVINNDIGANDCYNENLYSFSTLIEEELGIINGADNKLAIILHENPQFEQKYNEYIMASLTGNEMSITELIRIAVDVIKTKYGASNIRTLGDMRKAVEMNGKFTPPQEEQPIVSTQSLGEQVREEMFDVALTDNTQQVNENAEKNMNGLTK